MADNVVANPGVGGATFATDLIGGVQYPRSKVVWGPDGTATDTDVGAAALPIADGGNSITIDAASLPLPTGAATAAKQPALGTAGTASTDVITVQGIASGTVLPVSAASLPLPTGAATAAKQDTGNTSLASIDGKITAVNTGAVVISAAIPAGNNNIGDVDVVTVPAPLSTSGGGTEATALRVTIASNSTGVLAVTDNSGSLTVDGSVTANAGTNLNTSALALEAGGNLAAVAAAILAEDAASASADKGIQALAVRKATPANTSGTDGDYEPHQVSGGRLWTNGYIMGKKYDAAGATWSVKNAKLRSSTTGADVVAAVSSKKLRIVSYLVQSAGTVTFNFADTDGTALSPVLDFQAREGASRTAMEGTWLFETASGKGIEVTLSGAINVSVEITYLEED